MTETRGLVKDCARLCDSHVRLREAVKYGNDAALQTELAYVRDAGFDRAVYMADVSTLFGDDDFLFTAKGDVAYIAFLGTEAVLGEWLLNAATGKLRWAHGEGRAHVHGGFFWGWSRICDQLRGDAAFVDLQYDCSDVVICGHSRGGAIAQLAFPYLSSKFNVKKIITFGSPKVGDEGFVCYNERIRTPTLHVRNWLDPVPYLPVGGGFRHYGDVIRNRVWGHRMKLYNKWRGKS